MKQRVVVALTMLGVSMGFGSFVFDDEAIVAALRLGAGAPLVAALVVSVKGARRGGPRTMGERISAGGAVVGAFVAGALVFGHIADAQETSTAADRPFDITVAESSVAMPVSYLEVQPTEEHAERVLDDAEDAMAALEVVDGQAAEQLIAEARAVEYEPRAVPRLNWASAVVERAGATWLVTVPTAAPDDPLLNKVVFLTSGTSATVMEYSGRLLDQATLHFEIWQDGHQLKNVQAVNTVTTPVVDDITQVFDWGEFNRCLSSQGISWALLTAIGLACSAVCVGTAGLGCIGCLAFAAGGWSGTVLGCYYQVT